MAETLLDVSKVHDRHKEANYFCIWPTSEMNLLVLLR